MHGCGGTAARRGTELFKLGHFAAAPPHAVSHFAPISPRCRVGARAQALVAANWDFESRMPTFWATRLLSEMCCKAHLRFLNVCRAMIMNNVGRQAAWCDGRYVTMGNVGRVRFPELPRLRNEWRKNVHFEMSGGRTCNWTLHGAQKRFKSRHSSANE